LKKGNAEGVKSVPCAEQSRSALWFESMRGLRMESKRRKENRGLKETLFGYFFGKAFFKPFCFAKAFTEKRCAERKVDGKKVV